MSITTQLYEALRAARDDDDGDFGPVIFGQIQRAITAYESQQPDGEATAHAVLTALGVPTSYELAPDLTLAERIECFANQREYLAAGWCYDMTAALRDGTMLDLLLGPGDDRDHPLEDSAGPTSTIGFNNCVNDGNDAWLFAGWDWSQDEFVQGEGTPIAWRKRLLPTPDYANPIDSFGATTA